MSSTIDQDLIDIALEGLAKHKDNIDSLQSISKAIDNSLKTHLDLYATDKKVLLDKIESTHLDNKASLQEAINSLPIPKDGKDGINGTSVTVEDVKPILDTHIDTISKSVHSKLDKAIKSIPAPKNGKDGKDGKQGPKGLPGKNGAIGKNGETGKSGKDGTGIHDIEVVDGDIHIKLTNKTKKVVKLPEAKSKHIISEPPIQNARTVPMNVSGLAASNVHDAMIELKGKIVQSSVGNPFDVGTSEAFMFTFNPYDETHDGSFGYNSNNQLTSKTIEKHDGTVLYTVTFRYNGTQLSSKTISDNVNGGRVTVTYTYDADDRLISKAYTYTA